MIQNHHTWDSKEDKKIQHPREDVTLPALQWYFGEEQLHTTALLYEI